jgi:DNA-directed RNA polymerase specialized sigma24 family protein
MDEAAIAQTLGCPLGTVKWRLHAARKQLRQSLVPGSGRGTPQYEW